MVRGQTGAAGWRDDAITVSSDGVAPSARVQNADLRIRRKRILLRPRSVFDFQRVVAHLGSSREANAVFSARYGNARRHAHGGWRRCQSRRPVFVCSVLCTGKRLNGAVLENAGRYFDQ